MITNDQLKDYFKTGDKPTQAQFYQFIDELDRITFSSSMLSPTGSDALPWELIHQYIDPYVDKPSASLANRGFLSFDRLTYNHSISRSDGDNWNTIVGTINHNQITSERDDIPVLSSKRQMNLNAIDIAGCGVGDVNGAYIVTKFDTSDQYVVYNNVRNDLYICRNFNNCRYEIKKSLSGTGYHVDNVWSDPTIVFKPWSYIVLHSAGSDVCSGDYTFLEYDGHYPIYIKGDYLSGTDETACIIEFNVDTKFNELKDYTGSVLYRWGDTVTGSFGDQFSSLSIVSGSEPIPQFNIDDSQKINENYWIPSVSCSILYGDTFSPPTHTRDIVYIGTAGYKNVGTGSNEVARGDHVHEYTASVLVTSPSINIDFSIPYKDLYLEGDTTFTSSNLASVRQVNMRITTDGTERLMAFPVEWKWLNNSMPLSQSANTSGMLSAISWGTTDVDVQAVYSI